MTIYIADVSPLLETEVFDRARLLVPEERRAKADAMKFAAGKAQSLGAGLVLHEACRLQGIEGADEHICLGEHGKPDFDQKWLAENGHGEMHFSLSHSGERVLCGISAKPIGCDVEMHKSKDIKIARRFFTAEEYADIASQPDQAAACERFFRYWTLKESFMKCDGRGMNMPLDSFCIGIEPEGRSSVRTTGAAEGWSLFTLDICDGYSYGCCIKQECCSVEERHIDIPEVINFNCLK